MELLDILNAKRRHVARLAAERGAYGEAAVIAEMEHWMPRPKGKGLKVLLDALNNTGIAIKKSSFDGLC
ncbi:hypothetical protein [Massilia sp. UBA6681]|uniref:hypothetical protein n=1 Tax=Massilia sp. UBA6681 TaxID=1946839 RepID=UPI0025C00F47|nr:hypothetical protein [Massilia sp. UBA6681]